MNDYLVRLKAIEKNEKIFDKYLDHEVPKAPFATFDTHQYGEKEKNIFLIQNWLHQIYEPKEDHDLVLNKCKNDPEAMNYFLKHASGGFTTVNDECE